MSKPGRHQHTFTALWWHFGPHGRQGVHVHSCFRDGCDRVLVGEGRGCSGKDGDHRRETLSADRDPVLPGGER